MFAADSRDRDGIALDPKAPRRRASRREIAAALNRLATALDFAFAELGELRRALEVPERIERPVSALSVRQMRAEERDGE